MSVAKSEHPHAAKGEAIAFVANWYSSERINYSWEKTSENAKRRNSTEKRISVNLKDQHFPLFVFIYMGTSLWPPSSPQQPRIIYAREPLFAGAHRHCCCCCCCCCCCPSLPTTAPDLEPRGSRGLGSCQRAQSTSVREAARWM